MEKGTHYVKIDHLVMVLNKIRLNIAGISFTFFLLNILSLKIYNLQCFTSAYQKPDLDISIICTTA